MEKRSLLLFGGSFDPIHSGHLILARAALEQLRADECWFVPCAQSADGKRLTPGALRLAWLQQAVRGQVGLKVWDGELKRGGISRTVDTVQELSRPGIKLWVLMGADQAARLQTWKDVPTLRRLASIAVFGRGSERLSPGLTRLRAPLLDLSSTQVRLRLKSQKPCFSMLPPRLQASAQLRRAYAPALPKAA